MRTPKGRIFLILVMALGLFIILAGCGGQRKPVEKTAEGEIESELPEALKTIKGKSESAAREANLDAINSAIQSYFMENGQYPSSIEQLVPRYLQTIPLDPAGGTYYIKFEGGYARAAVR